MKRMIVVWALLVLSVFVWSEVPVEYKDREILTSVSSSSSTGITLSELFDERKFIEFEEDGKVGIYRTAHIIADSESFIIILDFMTNNKVEKQLGLSFIPAGNKYAILGEVLLMELDSEGNIIDIIPFYAEMAFEAILDVLYYNVSVPID